MTVPIAFPTGTLTLTPGATAATSYDMAGNTWATTLPVDAGAISYSTLSFLTASTTQLPGMSAVRGRLLDQRECLILLR